MPLAKLAGKNPREIAQAIVRRLDATGVAEPVSDANIAGPGFINLFLAKDALAAALDAMDETQPPPACGRGQGEGASAHSVSAPSPNPSHEWEGRRTLGIAPASPPKTIVVDLCGVNLAKQMHVGHLRSTIIGDCLARVFHRLGHTVIRQNHLGDWGLPIAMVTDRVMREHAAGRLNLDSLTLDDLDAHYRAAQRDCKAATRGLAVVERYDLGPKAAAELGEQVAGAEEALAHAKRTLINLQSGDPETVRIWER